MSQIFLTLDSGQTFDLPDLRWDDEFAWNPVAQTVKFLTPDENGEAAVLIQESVKLAGRPITLAGGAGFGWMTRQGVKALQQLAATRPAFILYVYGQSFAAAFRFDGAAIEAQPVVFKSPLGDEDYYQINAVKFITL